MASHAPSDGSATRKAYSRGGQDRSALDGLGPEPLQLAPEDPAEDEHEHRGAGDPEHQHRVIVTTWGVTAPATRAPTEQVDVDERPGEAEEDLLDDHAAEHARQVGAGDDRHVHQQADDGADVGGQEPVQRHAGRVGREDLEVGDASAREREAQDRVPAERRQRRLDGLERPAGDQIAEPDPVQRVPQVREPPEHVDAEHLEHRQRHHHGAEQASTLAIRRGREWSPNGSQRCRWGGGASVSVTEITFLACGMTRHHPDEVNRS